MIKSQLENSKKAIINYFDTSKSTIFTRQELKTVLEQHRKAWGLSSKIELKHIIQFLRKEGDLKKYRMKFPYKPTTRFVWGNVNEILIALSIDEDRFCSHLTAAYLHGLFDDPKKEIYVNMEQKNQIINKSTLTQEGIDRAFSNNPRITRRHAPLKERTVFALESKNVNQFGIEEMKLDGETIKVTSLERTLIDMVIRPFYSGGVKIVLFAYNYFASRVSITKLKNTLEKLDHKYPYHQAIGFYMKIAGNYTNSQMNEMKNYGLKWDFYLQNKMKNKSHSKEWRIYYPKGLKLSRKRPRVSSFYTEIARFGHRVKG